MNEAERQEKLRQQTDEQYLAIGKFVVKFEHICRELRDGIMWMLYEKGLADQRIADLMVEGLTAAPLTDRFVSLVAHTQQLSPGAEVIVKEILARVRDLIPKRNEVIHGTWFIGWGSTTQTDFSTASLEKICKKKNVARRKRLDMRVEDLELLTEEAEALEQLVFRLWVCLTSGHDVEKNFARSTDGEIVPFVVEV